MVAYKQQIFIFHSSGSQVLAMAHFWVADYRLLIAPSHGGKIASKPSVLL
jgi:hypothetical protein